MVLPVGNTFPLLLFKSTPNFLMGNQAIFNTNGSSMTEPALWLQRLCHPSSIVISSRMDTGPMLVQPSHLGPFAGTLSKEVLSLPLQLLSWQDGNFQCCSHRKNLPKNAANQGRTKPRCGGKDTHPAGIFGVSGSSHIDPAKARSIPGLLSCLGKQISLLA